MRFLRITLSMEEKAGATYQWYVAKGDGKDFEEIEGETVATYTLPALEPSMNGWMYRCAVIENGGTEEEAYTLADPVTLNLTGEGVPEAVTIHEISSASDLADALYMVAEGSWDNHTLKLMEDITYPQPVTLTGSRDVTIDLNGYTLTVQPNSTAEPNLNPMSDKPEIAAVYVHFGSLNITGTGQLDVVAGNGVAYGVYAAEGGFCGSRIGDYNNPSDDFDVIVTSTGSGTGIYAVNGGSVGLYNVSPAYTGGWADIEVSGENSRGAYVDGKGTWLSFKGDITVTGTALSADRG